jgi:hypothetical protein
VYDKFIKYDGKNNEEYETRGVRWFKCIVGVVGQAICTGCYSAQKPKQAASKACTNLYNAMKNASDRCQIENSDNDWTRVYNFFEDKKIPESVTLCMQECTRGRKCKMYFYTGRRVELAEPRAVQINKIDPVTNEPIVVKYHYVNDIKKLTYIENCKEYQLLANYNENNENSLDVIYDTNESGGIIVGITKGMVLYNNIIKPLEHKYGKLSILIYGELCYHGCENILNIVNNTPIIDYIFFKFVKNHNDKHKMHEKFL